MGKVVPGVCIGFLFGVNCACVLVEKGEFSSPLMDKDV